MCLADPDHLGHLLRNWQPMMGLPHGPMGCMFVSPHLSARRSRYISFRNIWLHAAFSSAWNMAVL